MPPAMFVPLGSEGGAGQLPGADAFEQRPETSRGKALFEELRWVHGMIRRDLEDTAFFPALRDAPEPRRA
jgi:hypothetical protein